MYAPLSMFKFHLQVAVVTGAGHGIGRCLALQLSKLGVQYRKCQIMKKHFAIMIMAVSSLLVSILELLVWT